MASFSWADNLQAALSPCVACFRSQSHAESDDDSHGPEYVPRARPDELEGLLADSDDAETLSLHSNVGDPRSKRAQKRAQRSIKMFGFYLFGRPPIHLPDDEDDDLPVPRHHHGIDRPRTVSAMTFDSDASPLDPSTINELSAAQVAARMAQQHEEERLAKEERRRRRRERKELRRAALTMALEGANGEEFEGFQVCLSTEQCHHRSWTDGCLG